MEKVRKINPDRKPGVDVNIVNIMILSAAKPRQNVMPCIPFDLLGTNGMRDM